MPEPTYRIAQRLHERRAAKGLETYGRHLDADSQGCMLVHALEEAADQVNYLIADIQRRREAIRILLDTAERLTQWDDVNLNEDARQLVRVIDLLGGESALAQYDEILGGGTVAENATVDPRDEALRVATKLVEKLDAVHNDPKYELVWAVHQQHYGPYCGPQYDRELDELKAALAADNARLRKALLREVARLVDNCSGEKLRAEADRIKEEAQRG